MRKRYTFPAGLFLSLVLLVLAPASAAQSTMVMAGPGWQVMKAEWGAGNRWLADKVLTVIYRYNGREQTSTVKEGNALRIP